MVYFEVDTAIYIDWPKVILCKKQKIISKKLAGFL